MTHDRDCRNHPADGEAPLRPYRWQDAYDHRTCPCDQPKAGKGPGRGQVADAAPVTKADIVIGLLARPAGATIAQMCEATGWQQHSVRGFLAGKVKKKAGVTLNSDKTDAGRIYRLTTNDAVPA